MNQPAYAFESSEDSLLFRFDSVSEDRRVAKLIVYAPIPQLKSVYNLALLDLRNDGTTDDLSVSNNQDMPHILATVAQTMLQFFGRYPGSTIAFSGSTSARTRLYRIAISQNLSLVEPILTIEGFQDGVTELFQPNRPYEAFFIRLRK